MFFWVPMTIFLSVLWLLLSNHLSIGQGVIGGLSSFIFVLLSLRMRPHLAYPRRLFLIVTLTLIVMRDFLISNIQVGKLILQWKRKDINSGFVAIPLDIRDPHALAFLACIVTYTPGTVWSGLTENDFILRLHVLDLKDESIWFDTIKHHYEKYLLEIFES